MTGGKLMGLTDKGLEGEGMDLLVVGSLQWVAERVLQGRETCMLTVEMHMQLVGRMFLVVVAGQGLMMLTTDPCTVNMLLVAVDGVGLVVVGENTVTVSRAEMSPLKATHELALGLEMPEMLVIIVKVCYLLFVVTQSSCFIVHYFLHRTNV